MNIPRIREVILNLESPMPEDFMWRFSVFYVPSLSTGLPACGCACGLLHHLKILKGLRFPEEDLKEYLDMDHAVVVDIFVPEPDAE
jgi:hypothetical protein